MESTSGKTVDESDENNSISTATTTTRSTSTSETQFSPTTFSTSAKRRRTPPGDPSWDAIKSIQSGENVLSLADLHFICRLGSGDMGSVYLVELKNTAGGNTACFFAAKIMDKEELAKRNKESRARVERKVLVELDHPFLPTLYAVLDCPKWSCLLTEFCPGGDLHVLRQRQPDQRFHESDVRFYSSEIVVALEYLHMMGIIYRDIKPENILIRSDGHIMLTDFDLSLKSEEDLTSTTILVSYPTSSTAYASSFRTSQCMLAHCMVPPVSCFRPGHKRRNKSYHGGDAVGIVAEPTVRSMSFVGTHEYLAPEIVLREGHGNAVDWWTLGILMFEMLYGVTPFKGVGHEVTLANIVTRAVEFPKEPKVSTHIKDLISKLLIKDPSRRMGSTMGATTIKRHRFFNEVNWALLRCEGPPYIPQSMNYHELAMVDTSVEKLEYY